MKGLEYFQKSIVPHSAANITPKHVVWCKDLCSLEALGCIRYVKTRNLRSVLWDPRVLPTTSYLKLWALKSWFLNHKIKIKRLPYVWDVHSLSVLEMCELRILRDCMSREGEIRGPTVVCCAVVSPCTLRFIRLERSHQVHPRSTIETIHLILSFAGVLCNGHEISPSSLFTDIWKSLKILTLILTS